jgi:hypothetical protein
MIKEYPAPGTTASYVGEYDHMKRDTYPQSNPSLGLFRQARYSLPLLWASKPEGQLLNTVAVLWTIHWSTHERILPPKHGVVAHLGRPDLWLAVVCHFLHRHHRRIPERGRKLAPAGIAPPGIIIAHGRARHGRSGEARIAHPGEESPMWWHIGLPTRSAVHFEGSWRPESGWQSSILDAGTGEALVAQPRGSRAMFLLYWLHFRLHGLPGLLGHWLVGAMAVAMLVLLVTGIIVHKRIFTDFFTFRPGKAPARSWLDAHNVSSVMTLSFALMITYSGLTIFWLAWMPARLAGLGWEAMRDKTRPALNISETPGEAAPTLPLWFFAERARARLTVGQALRLIFVFHPGGTQTQVHVSHGNDALLWDGSDEKIFNGLLSATWYGT